MSDLIELADGVFALLPEFSLRHNCNIGVTLEDDGLTLIDMAAPRSVYGPPVNQLVHFNRPVTRIIPGHGPIGDRNDVQTVSAYIHAVMEAAENDTSMPTGP